MAEKFPPCSDNQAAASGRVAAPKFKSGKMTNQTLEKGKAKIKTTRNLLPSKVIVGHAPTGAAGKPKIQLPSKAMHSFAQNPQKIITDEDRIDNAYELYLQTFLTNVLIEETLAIQESAHVDSAAVKCVEAASMDAKVGKLYADKVVQDNFDDSVQLDKLKNTFNDLDVFTNDENLVEIQSALSRKYDRIPINSAAVLQPIFQKNEIENMMQILKVSLDENHHEDKIMGFGFSCAETLSKLNAKAEAIRRKNDELQFANKVILENCSVGICSLAQSASQNES